MKGYEKEYHTDKHRYLHNDEYYKARAKLTLKKYFNNVQRGQSVLEFGCGMGQNIYYLPNAYGYDISSYALQKCREKRIKVYNDFDKVPENSFDVVFSCHVLEHLEDPLKNIKQLRKKLKKDGKLILVLPVEKHRKASFRPDKNQHLYSWNFRTINNLLAKSGFKVTENEYLRGKAYMKLLPFSSISFGLYSFLTGFAGLFGGKEMKIVAVKK